MAEQVSDYGLWTIDNGLQRKDLHNLQEIGVNFLEVFNGMVKWCVGNLVAYNAYHFTFMAVN